MQQNNDATLFSKLARVMGHLNRIPKNGHNRHFNYRYATESDVADAVRDALAKENVAFFATLNQVDHEADKTIVSMSFTFACGDTGATRTCDWKGEAIDKQDKGLSKAYTAAEKYFLLKTFVISTGDEPDSDSEAHDNHPTPLEIAKKDFLKRAHSELTFDATDVTKILMECGIKTFRLDSIDEMWNCLQTEFDRLSIEDDRPLDEGRMPIDGEEAREMAGV